MGAADDGVGLVAAGLRATVELATRTDRAEH
jgi:hypothetical protein